MSWPWSTIGLTEQATPTEIRAALENWRSHQSPEEDSADHEHIERAFEAALELAQQRDPSHLHHSQFPNAWADNDQAPPPQLPALRPEHPPQSDAETLASTLQELVRQSPDFEAFAIALARIPAWRNAETRRGADAQLREWLVDGSGLTPLQVVRLARAFSWTPESSPLQVPERDLDWRRVVSQAYNIVAPPDPAYTGSIGRGFLIAGGVAAVGLSLLLLPRVMSGGVRLLIPVAFAALCAWLLIRWRK